MKLILKKYIWILGIFILPLHGMKRHWKKQILQQTKYQKITASDDIASARTFSATLPSVGFDECGIIGSSYDILPEKNQTLACLPSWGQPIDETLELFKSRQIMNNVEGRLPHPQEIPQFAIPIKNLIILNETNARNQNDKYLHDAFKADIDILVAKPLLLNFTDNIPLQYHYYHLGSFYLFTTNERLDLQEFLTNNLEHLPRCSLNDLQDSLVQYLPIVIDKFHRWNIIIDGHGASSVLRPVRTSKFCGLKLETFRYILNLLSRRTVHLLTYITCGAGGKMRDGVFNGKILPFPVLCSNATGGIAIVMYKRTDGSSFLQEFFEKTNNMNLQEASHQRILEAAELIFDLGNNPSLRYPNGIEFVPLEGTGFVCTEKEGSENRAWPILISNIETMIEKDQKLKKYVAEYYAFFNRTEIDNLNIFLPENISSNHRANHVKKLICEDNSSGYIMQYGISGLLLACINGLHNNPQQFMYLFDEVELIADDKMEKALNVAIKLNDPILGEHTISWQEEDGKCYKQQFEDYYDDDIAKFREKVRIINTSEYLK